MHIQRCTRETLPDWIALRQALWPHEDEQQLRVEAEAALDLADSAVVFLALNVDLVAVGFAEATLRRDSVNGCTTSPVAFLEGIYVRPVWRNRGIARRLSNAVEAWAVGLGCSEFASDTELHNRGAQQMHAALGFEETERVVRYRKRIP